MKKELNIEELENVAGGAGVNRVESDGTVVAYAGAGLFNVNLDVGQAITATKLKEIITLTIVRKAELQAAGKAEQGRGDSPLCVVKCALTVLMVKRICFL